MLFYVLPKFHHKTKLWVGGNKSLGQGLSLTFLWWWLWISSPPPPPSPSTSPSPPLLYFPFSPFLPINWWWACSFCFLCKKTLEGRNSAWTLKPFSHCQKPISILRKYFLTSTFWLTWDTLFNTSFSYWYLLLNWYSINKVIVKEVC